MQRDTINLIRTHVEALHPIIYINHFDFCEVDDIILHINNQSVDKAEILEYNNALGIVNFENKSSVQDCTLEEFLKMTWDNGFDRKTFLVLKDIQNELENPSIIAFLRRIAEFATNKSGYSMTIFIVSSICVIPQGLENYITVFDIPAPSTDEILNLIYEFSEVQESVVDPSIADSIALSLKGLSKFQISQILYLAFQSGGVLDKKDEELIKNEKKQIIRKSGMLELINVTDNISNIGGLEILKTWLNKKAKLFKNLDKAIKFGVDIPKGLLIVGMPGCGKSLTAKATSLLFNIPLVRLDIGRLLGKYVGESENNMRRALSLSQRISPCVLWIDEIEKAFAGVEGNDVTTRLFGQFLTWMQEKDNSVFVVATANNISKLPPEFLRKGRFDEIFFVDLPNEIERKRIFEIHIKKRNQVSKDIKTDILAKKTTGYSGADIEAVVKDAVETAFINNATHLTTDNFLKEMEGNKSISDILGDKIKELHSTIDKYNIKRATKSTQNDFDRSIEWIETKRTNY